jgi:hypothetical protein
MGFQGRPVGALRKGTTGTGVYQSDRSYHTPEKSLPVFKRKSQSLLAYTSHGSLSHLLAEHAVHLANLLPLA